MSNKPFLLEDGAMHRISYLRTPALIVAFIVVIVLLPFTFAAGQSSPVLEVNPKTIHFFEYYCGESMPPQGSGIGGFMVANAGYGDMTWSGTADEPWVAFEPTQGGNYDSVAVWIDWSEFTPPVEPQLPGDTVWYEASITIEANTENSPQVIEIILAVFCPSEEYILIVEPSFFDITMPPGTTTTKWLYVEEAQGAVIGFFYYNNSNWLMLPQTFTIMYTPDSVQFTIVTEGLQPGYYIDTIFVVADSASSNSPIAVPVMLGVEGDPSDYVVQTSPHYFNLVVPADTVWHVSLSVYEIHGQSVWFHTTVSASWMEVIGGSFFMTPAELDISISTFGLSPGYYTDTVFIYPDTDSYSFTPVGVPVVIYVEGEEPEYEIATTPRYLDLGMPVDTEMVASVSVYEVHGHSVWFRTSESASWMEVAGGPVFTTPTDLEIIFSTYGLSPGFYADTVFIFPDTDGVWFPSEAIAVFLEVGGEEPEYEIVTTPQYLNLGMPVDTDMVASVSVYEVHGHSVWFRASESASWMEVAGGPVFTTPTDLEINFSTYGLAPGFYADTVFIFPDSDGVWFPSEAIAVFLEVGDEPIVHAVPEYFEFTLEPGDTVLYSGLWVYEQSGDEIWFMAETINGSPWLSVYYDTLWEWATPDSVFFYIYTEGLTPGVYVDSIVIYDPTDDLIGWFQPVVVPVTLTIQGEPTEHTLQVMPESFSFVLEPEGIGVDTLFVYDALDAMVGFEYYDDAAWLVVNPFGMPPYVTPLHMPIAVHTDSLPPGHYSATIFVRQVPDTSGGTLAVPVSLTVSGGAYLSGDANGDEVVNLGDAVYLIAYIFREGPAPDPLDTADANCDGMVNVGDVVTIISYIFRNGYAPGCP
jgi:hypothetical protein